MIDAPPHGPGWVGVDNCYIHGYEPWPDRFYIRCFECGHVYNTPDDLRRAYRREIEGIERSYLNNPTGAWFFGLLEECPHIDPLVVPPTEEIYFCQECTHDF